MTTHSIPQQNSKAFRAYIYNTLRTHYIFVARDGETFYVRAKSTASALFGDEINVPLNRSGRPDFSALGFRSAVPCPRAKWDTVKALWQHNDPQAGRGKQALTELKAAWDSLMARLATNGSNKTEPYHVQIHRS